MYNIKKVQCELYDKYCLKKTDVETSKMIVFYFLFISADRQTHNYDTRVLKLPSLPINPKAKGISSRSKMKLWAIYTNLPVNAIVRLLHPWSGDSQSQEMFLAPSVDKQTHNFDTRVLKTLSLPINPKAKGMEL